MNPTWKSTLTKIFSIAGTVLLWAPILFMLLTAVVGSIMRGALLFDYLMLAELFFVVLAGMILLILAGILSRTLVKWLCWGAGAALAALAGGQILAVASGLASGAMEPGGLVFAVVIASIVVYNLSIVLLAVLGIVLIRRVFRKKIDSPTDPAQ
ncbi:MAG: hypothetical protein R2912_06425 [Eubacteriales bacterium]